MGLFDKINSYFSNEAEEVRDEQGYTWHSEYDGSDYIWQLNYAITVVANLLATFFINVEWKTYKAGKIVKQHEWYKLNYAPNKKETSAEFFTKLAKKLINDGQALIIELATGELFIADTFQFLGGQELYLKDNTFTDIQIGQERLNRTFKENKNCVLIRTPLSGNQETFGTMESDYNELKALIRKGANKALGMKLNLNLAALPKNKYDADYLKKMQAVYNPLMDSRNAVFITYKGETLTDLTERQRGSEVQQILEAVDNNIKVNKEVLCNVGSAYGIPQKFMTGDYTADNQDIYTMAVTMFAKPFLSTVAKKLTLFMLDEDSIIKGGKIEANLDSIKFNEMLKQATAVDKLIGSGAYTINEVREKVGDDPTTDTDGNVRFITKNYAVMKEYVKGGVSTDEV